MRISTNQFYLTNTNNIVERQSQVNQSVMDISSGKRVNTAGDDAVAAHSILNLKQEQELLSQYQTNITFANSRLNVEESAVQSAEDVMFRVKDLLIQGNSVGNDDAARQAIADELQQRFNELVSLSNTRDESGSYIFGGFKTQTAPFQVQSDASVDYVGDQGQRLTNVGPGVQAATSDPGDKIFMDIANSTGDFKPVYQLNDQIDNLDRAIVSEVKITDAANYVPVANPDQYSINFTTMADSQLGMSISDSEGNQVYPNLPELQAPYVAGQTVSFNGISTTLEKTPQPGDAIVLSPQSTVDVFSTIQSAITWLEQPNGIGVDEAQSQLDYGHLLADIDQIQINLGSVRADIGARMQVTDSQQARHSDYNITLETSRTALEDLDLVSAISNFEQQKLSLQASQTAFSQLQNMNLLNFL